MRKKPILSTTLDSFTFRRNHKTDSITVDCILTARSFDHEPIMTFGLSIDIDDYVDGHARALASALHAACRKKIASLDQTIAFTPETPWLQ